MRFIKYFFPVLIVGTLSGCTGHGMHSDDYIKQSAAVHPIVVPAGAIPPEQKAYYRVPSVSVRAHAGTMSLLPPGSNVLQYRDKAKSKNHVSAQMPVVAHLENGNKRLILSLNANRAWSVVGRALGKTPYQILEKDKSMKTYYVLDLRSTSNKITQSTPIYRLAIKQVGDISVVHVLNQENQPATAQMSSKILKAVQKQLT